MSPFLSADPPRFPFVALLVSGGHTQLMRVDDVGRYTLLGETIDDAAGEAFDKTAKMMGLPYPGGPALARLAAFGDAAAFDLPRPLLHSGNLDFSFSGLKTAVMTRVAQARQQRVRAGPRQPRRGDAGGDRRRARAQVGRRARAPAGLTRLVVAGGVGANAPPARAARCERAPRLGARVHYPELALCTDNGAMIALAAAMRLQRGLADARRDYTFDVRPRWSLAAA